MTVQTNIPAGVTATEGLWYIRVWRGDDATGQWSDKDEALPFKVGTPVLACDADVNSGNFGTLDFPRSDNTSSDDIAINIAVGLELPLTPVKHAWAAETPSSSGECVEGEHEAAFPCTTHCARGLTVWTRSLVVWRQTTPQRDSSPGLAGTQGR